MLVCVCVRAFLCMKTLQCQQHRHHIKRLSEKQSLLCVVFVNSQELEILRYPHITSSCRLNWFGQSTWFWLLGKLVPWRNPIPSSLCWTKADKTDEEETLPENGCTNSRVSIPIHCSDLTTAPLPIPSPLLPFLTNSPYITIPSVAVGAYLSEGLQGGGCERRRRRKRRSRSR